MINSIIVCSACRRYTACCIIFFLPWPTSYGSYLQVPGTLCTKIIKHRYRGYMTHTVIIHDSTKSIYRTYIHFHIIISSNTDRPPLSLVFSFFPHFLPRPRPLYHRTIRRSMLYPPRCSALCSLRERFWHGHYDSGWFKHNPPIPSESNVHAVFERYNKTLKFCTLDTCPCRALYECSFFRQIFGGLYFWGHWGLQGSQFSSEKTKTKNIHA